jgi:hypothetical protein
MAQKTLEPAACHADPMVQERIAAWHASDEKAHAARRCCAWKAKPLIVMHSVIMSHYALIALS